MLQWLICIQGLHKGKVNLDYTLDLKIKDFFWEVFKLILGKSIHPDWVLIHQHHIRVHKQVVNIGSFIVCLDSQKHIYLLPLLSLPGGLMKRKNTKKGQSGAEAGNDEEEV